MKTTLFPFDPMNLRITTLTILAFATIAFPFLLDSVLARGDSCLNVEWTPDSANTRQCWFTRWSSRCRTDADTAYRHCDFQPGVSYRGLAYSYGGRDAFFDFRTKLSLKRVVGSHSCHYDSYFAAGINIYDSVAGTDCSGFVCYVWNVPRVATGTLASKYPAISKSALEPGDILVKANSHTVLIVEIVDPTHFLIWEASPTYHGCRERIIDITTTPWSDASYLARRNSTIVAIVTNAPGQRASGPLYRITALQEGKTVSLCFAKSFTGTLEIRTAAGKTVCRKTIVAVAGTVQYPLENPLACGMYVSALKNTMGTFVRPVAFMVIK